MALGLFRYCIARLFFVALFTFSQGLCTLAQTVSSPPAETPTFARAVDQTPKSVVGYLHGSQPNFLLSLRPYPVLDSPQDAVDVATFRQMQVADETQRWKLAQGDAQIAKTTITHSGRGFDQRSSERD